jgi:hypothetical protein
LAVVSDPITHQVLAAGAPIRPAEFGWPAALYRMTVRRARQIRNRYTFHDFAGDAASLDAFCLDEG